MQKTEMKNLHFFNEISLEYRAVKSPIGLHGERGKPYLPDRGF